MLVLSSYVDVKLVSNSNVGVEDEILFVWWQTCSLGVGYGFVLGSIACLGEAVFWGLEVLVGGCSDFGNLDLGVRLTFLMVRIFLS